MTVLCENYPRNNVLYRPAWGSRSFQYTFVDVNSKSIKAVEQLVSDAVRSNDK